MGSLCSKEDATIRQSELANRADNKDVHNAIHKPTVPSTTSSSSSSTKQKEKHDQDKTHALHSNHHHASHGKVSDNFDCITRVVLGDFQADDKKGNISLITCPPTESLLCRFWIYKRGHLVRTWKKRYCVLDKTDLKYYAKESKEPPYGKGFKGKVALLGAVCLTQISKDGKHIEVEIFGNHGEKDLFFYVENTVKGEEFVRLLQWAIRKATLTMLIRNLKTISTAKNDEKLACREFTEHQNMLYESSIRCLQYSQLYHFVSVEENGVIVIRPGIMRLWTAFGKDFTPTLQTEATHMGIGWKYVEHKDANKLMTQYTTGIRPESFLMASPPVAGQESAEDEEFDDIRVLTFDDILDITYKYIDPDTTKVLRPQMCAFHHDPDCPVLRYILVTIQSNFGHNLHMLTCCFNDHDQSVTSLCNIMRFIQARNKLLQATAMSDKSQNHGNMTAAAKALRLLDE